VRLTNEIRESIVRKAIANLPVVDYKAMITETVQNAVIDAMPPEVRAVWDNEATRRYLIAATVEIRDGNKHVMSIDGIRGISGADLRYRSELAVYMDNATQGITRPISAKIAAALRSSGHVAAYQRDKERLANVKSRLTSALASVTTVKRLFDVLEPELHHLIPVIVDNKVPALSVKVADDLRALGAELPVVAQKEEAK
jgi:hypothetical protein